MKKGKIQRALIIIGVLFLLFFKIVFVYEGNIFNPTEGLEIDKYFTPFLGNNCEGHDRRPIPSFFIYMRSKCETNVINQYHHVIVSSKQTFSPFTFININTSNLRPLVIYDQLRFYEQDKGAVTVGLDVLKLIETNTWEDEELSVEERLNGLKKHYDEISKSPDQDFQIETLKNPPSGIYPDRFLITFSGEGGIQKIDPSNKGIAPKNGYNKSIELRARETYVARLRDGKHYMIIEFKDDGTVKTSPYIYLYISSREGERLNFTDHGDYYYGNPIGVYDAQFFYFPTKHDPYHTK